MKEKTAEELLRENARLRGDLLTISTRISHDLRTPLGSISNSAELLNEIFLEHQLSPAPLGPVFTAVDEMMRLIKSVSLLAKASAHPPGLKKIKMSEAVYPAWQRVERQILKRKVTVDVSDSWPEINGVSEWLEFVWWQFLSNALQHGGKEIRVGWQKQNGFEKFFVRDSGAEIPPERRAKLFQPFEQLHQIASARGLGLAMSHRLVELQNGSCGYEFDGGSVFYFMLPEIGSKLEPARSGRAQPKEAMA